MPNHRTHKRTLRVFLAAFGEGPWTCVVCDKLVHRLGRYVGEGNVHHKDGDETNDVPENFEVMHHECHARLHMSRSRNRAHVDKVNAANRGQTRTLEARAKMRAAQLVRATCSICGYTSSKSWVVRHKCPIPQ